MINNQDVKIIDGRKIATNLLIKLKGRIREIKDIHNIIPQIAIILVGDNYASKIYVNNKLRAAHKVGMAAIKIEIDPVSTTETLINTINKLNNDADISGIIVQLPLPSHIDKNRILAAIIPEKDVDGFHPLNVGYLNSNINKGFVPCTALGCLKLIKHCNGQIVGKNAVIINRSQIVGRPLAALLLRNNATVTICHSKTENLKDITKHADIVITGIGVPNFFTADFFNSESIVIDVGINRIRDNQLTGDVDFLNVCDKVKHISPVPGGVGQMTVAFLLINTFKAFARQHGFVEFENE